MGWTPVDLLIPDVDMFRFGNASSTKLDSLRPNDATIEIRNGAPYIIADGKGQSLFDRFGADTFPVTGVAYLLPAGTTLPGGMRLVNDIEHHYNLAPIYDMRLAEFLSLCRVLALQLTFAFKKK